MSQNVSRSNKGGPGTKVSSAKQTVQTTTNSYNNNSNNHTHTKPLNNGGGHLDENHNQHHMDKNGAAHTQAALVTYFWL